MDRHLRDLSYLTWGSKRARVRRRFDAGFLLRVPSGSFISAWDTRPISVLPNLQIDLEDHQNLKLVSD